MSDYIDRQAAIDAIKNLPTWWGDSGGYYGGAQPPMEALLEPIGAVSAIENIPSADVELVRHGRWKMAMLDHEAFGERPFIYFCSKCCQCVVSKTDYCPNCGAHMVEVEHETD